MDRIKKVVVFFADQRCGVLSRTESKFRFQYDAEYLKTPGIRPLSRSLPLRTEAFESAQFFPYFAGLVSEGWLLQQQSALEKIDPRDYLTLLACNGEDLAGAVVVRPHESATGGCL